MRFRHVIFGLVLLAPMGVAVASAAPAMHATPGVNCGATIKTNMTLGADLSCPEGNGLTLARGVTLNLGGHRLIGPSDAAIGAAITLSSDGTSTIAHGSIEGRWANAVTLATNNLDAKWIAHMTGINVSGLGQIGIREGNLAILGSQVSTSFGLSVSLGSVFIRNSTFTNTRLSVSDSSANITNSTLDATSVAGTDAGLVTVNRSTMDGHHRIATGASCNDSILDVVNSTVRNYVFGVSGGGCLRVVAGDTFTGNDTAIVTNLGDHGGAGDPSSNTIAGNTFRANGVGINAGDSVVVADNTFTANTTGFLSAANGALIELTSNTFTKNLRSGIHVDDPDVVVRDNIATYNGRYGIYALEANDGGGNVARGNKLKQCVGIRCTFH